MEIPVWFTVLDRDKSLQNFWDDKKRQQSKKILTCSETSEFFGLLEESVGNKPLESEGRL